LAAVLTPKRLALLAVVKSQQQFESIERLAEALDRDRSSVSKDLKILANAGLLLVAQKALRGHGLRTEIKRAAENLKLEMFI
jgi:predicted transcriptional regulator